MERKNRMKILHLLYSDRYSGAENVVCQIIGMFREDSDVEMVYCSRDGQIREALMEQNICFVPIEDLTVKNVKNVIKEQKPDVIHAHDMRASFIAALACGSIPLISHIHNNAFASRGLSIKSIAYLIAAGKAKHIFWVSQSAYEGYFFKEIFQKKSSVLCNILNVQEVYQKMHMDSNEYEYDVVFVGRLTYQKNPQRLMQVLAKVVAKMPQVKVGIVGTGELESEIKSLGNELEIEKNVSFLGFQSNPLKILHNAKVMVMTSRWEGTPMCALEAMALGVPIVSTPTDGLKELVINGQNGFLSDDDSELCAGIVNIIDDTELHKVFSENTIRISQEINNVENYKRCLETYYH